MKEVGQHFWRRKQDQICLLNDSKIYSVFRTKICLGKKDVMCKLYLHQISGIIRQRSFQQ